jgi:cytochrome c oxidase subunit 2
MANVFSLVLAIAGVIFLVVAVGVIYSSVRYRARGVTVTEPRQIFGSRKLEILWTVVPLAIMTALFVITVRAMVLIDAPQASGQTPDLIVTGHQWWWDARYPNGALATGDIHIPAERRLLVRIESADVIHDFWAPELARKMDAVPGRPSYIWLEADAPGSYSGACSEFCGAQHAWMRFRVVAQTEADFEAWLQHQTQAPPEPTGIAAEGARLFQAKKCADCHSLGREGPDLAHVATREFLGGGISRNTPADLALWLTDPQAAKPGNRMPATPLSANERNALLAYLESLQ